MSNDELESQLSAMLDGELPARECELLARRLSRDEALKARWGRYAAIGAAMRMEPAAFVGGSIARRVSLLIVDEPALLVGAVNRGASGAASSLRKWWRPTVGAAGTVAAAGVAAVAVFLLRAGNPATPLATRGAAANGAAVPTSTVAAAGAQPTAQPVAQSTAQPSNESSGLEEVSANSAPASGYAVGAPVVESASFAPTMQLVDLLVAHSEFSTPFLQRTALSALVGSETVATVSSSTSRGRSGGSVHESSANFEVRHATVPR